MSKTHPKIHSVEPLPTAYELKSQFPITLSQRDFVEKSRDTIVQILNGEDNRRLLIAGPCSIHDIESAKEYAYKLKELAEEVSPAFFVIMRAYIEKPRTLTGWKGWVYDPHLNGTNAIQDGLKLSRELFLHLADIQIPAATEFLDINTHYYFSDLISWGCVGARTAESQPHRLMASGLPTPIGFKNSTSGNVDLAINAILCASQPHTFVGLDDHGKAAILRTTGNPHTHLVLRGGEKQPNYDAVSIKQSAEQLQQANLAPHIVVDCSHDNARRQHNKQIHVFQSLVHQIVQGDNSIRGMILESHLESGHQILCNKPENLKYGVSITDPCLDWKTTRDLVLWGCEALKARHFDSFKLEPATQETDYAFN